MVEKLRLTLNQIPWSLLLKAFLFGAGWMVLPFWVFVVFSLYLFLVPWFQPRKLLVPFVATMLLASFIEPNFWTSAFFSVVFFFILGIKDLLFVDRTTAFSLLVFVLSFLSILFSFSKFDSGMGLYAFAWFLGLSGLIFLIVRSFINYSFDDIDRRKKNTFLGIMLLLFLELGISMLFLPINFFAQTALLFFSLIVLLEIASDHFAGKMNPKRGLAYFSLIFTVFVVILAFAEFTI